MITKNLVLLVTCCIIYSISNGQTTTKAEQVETDSLVYLKVDKEASFKGGDKAWRTFLQNSLNHMVLVDNNAPDGMYQVVVRFIILADGSVTDIECENSPGYGVCEEGIRVIKKSSRWIPAQVNGKNVNAFRRQPISLFIQGG